MFFGVSGFWHVDVGREWFQSVPTFFWTLNKCFCLKKSASVKLIKNIAVLSCQSNSVITY